MNKYCMYQNIYLKRPESAPFQKPIPAHSNSFVQRVYHVCVINIQQLDSILTLPVILHPSIYMYKWVAVIHGFNAGSRGMCNLCNAYIARNFRQMSCEWHYGSNNACGEYSGVQHRLLHSFSQTTTTYSVCCKRFTRGMWKSVDEILRRESTI